MVAETVMLWALFYNPVSHDLATVEISALTQEECEMTLKLFEFEGLSDDKLGDYNLVMGGCL